MTNRAPLARQLRTSNDPRAIALTTILRLATTPGCKDSAQEAASEMSAQGYWARRQSVVVLAQQEATRLIRASGGARAACEALGL
jgi:hypothetical protein